MFPFAPRTFAIIVADGEKPSSRFLHFWAAQAQALFAADGAAHWCIKNGIVPQAIVGDLDSFSLKHQAVHYDANQNTNDLEKTIIHAITNGFKNIFIIGAFGLRSDHFLTNIHVLKKYAEDMNVVFIHHNQIAFMCRAKKNITIPLKKNDFISLFPLHHHTGPVTTSGLSYPLNNEILSLSQRLGTLNKVENSPVSLYCENAHLLVIIPYRRSLILNSPR